ncbi:NADPH:quinone reductase-like Zn-dependent oxidoreductase [Pseudomonas lini]|jgi:NADPH:quinone reductase-like Zn-dependent oxidoreductase|uniref:zinc-binding dehydrogenase n=1 Tax=Pseudomonas lini TaxID=163011 RepID=UPI002784C3A6|nr:zinc-binding dehydrogenase [Pseudomonas lini]MDQ0124783.1 NADPH:quinone reductase-like Zn-dependent oxidoreductase [Pseudomonas lini]
MLADFAAWSWTSGKGIDGLELIRKPLVQPGRGEVLVANRALALNPVDWKIIEWGHPAWNTGRVPGVDGMGVVVASGVGVSIKPGTRVAYHQSLERDGSFAEFCLLDAATVLTVPAALDDTVAASLPCPGLTAWQALDKVPMIGPSDVLVVGAGGAVGLLLVQMAVQRGYRVWATAATKHHENLKTLGVVGVFDYRDGNWQKTLQAHLGERRLKAVFDTVSAAHAASLAPLLGYNGHLVCIQDRQETAPLPAFSTAISLHEVALNSFHAHASLSDRQSLRQAGERLLEDVLAGSLNVPKRQNFDFYNLPQALHALKQGGDGGKWVARLEGSNQVE